MTLVLSVLCPVLAVTVTSHHGSGCRRLPLGWLEDERLVPSQEHWQLWSSEEMTTDPCRTGQAMYRGSGSEYPVGVMARDLGCSSPQHEVAGRYLDVWVELGWHNLSCLSGTGSQPYHKCQLQEPMTCTQCLSWAGTVCSLSGNFMSTERDSPGAAREAIEEDRDTLRN